jgi:hypothetical protein
MDAPGSPRPYPLSLTVAADEPLSRWLWLVKWLLLIPHFIVLAFLWIGVVLATIVAFFAILFTGRYPRGMFDFCVGVMRWTWRVNAYGYGALATDRYPPFRLADDPDYPARLEVEYPEHLSRGLVLVKSWLLAIPHLLVVAAITGGVVLGARSTNGGDHAEIGLVGLLGLILGVALLFTGRVPRGVFDLLVGLQRWMFRVGAYVALMTDEYPPLRLDQGPDEPTPGRVEPRRVAPPDTGGGTQVLAR